MLIRAKKSHDEQETMELKQVLVIPENAFYSSGTQ